MSITHSVTMANIKPEDAENSLWQSYSLHAPPSASSHQPTFEPNFPSGPLGISYHRQPQKGSYRSLDIPSPHQRPPPRDGGLGNGILTASPPPLNTHHSYPSLKRPFEESQYAEIVQTFSRDDLQEVPKPSINQDHRLLSFSKLPEKHTILDSHGRVHQIELQAQIHGMFFLSEMTTPSGEGVLVQPELTCYRRNLFQISGTVTAPRGSLSVMTERGDRNPIISMEVCISASESVDGHNVKLIVIPWKTPPPNSPEVGPGVEHEPTPIPLQSFEESTAEGNTDFSVYPIAYRRLQFRIATANNGRRRELQQHFTLHLNVVATLSNGTKINVCETSTAPIVVRGRSPRNFQARKEIPLVGSSSSRGGPPELHVSTSVAPVANPISAPAGKPKPSKVQNMELPRTAFTFDVNNLPPSPGIMRQSTYPSYLPSNPPEHTTAPSTPNFQAPMTLDSFLQANPINPVPSSNLSLSSPTAGSQPAIRQQYTYNPTTSPQQNAPPLRFIDSNPRPAKSPRHVPPLQGPTGAVELPSSTSYSDYGTRFAPTYNASSNATPYNANNNAPPYTSNNSNNNVNNDLLPPPRDAAYFPTSTSLHMQNWSATSVPQESTGVYAGGSVMQEGLRNQTQQQQHQQQHYQFPNEGYGGGKETGNSQQQNYTWNTS